MNQISNSINSYYLTHFDDLLLDAQVHFSSRLYFWTNESQYRELVDAVKASLVPNDDITAIFDRLVNGELFPLSAGNRSLTQRRKVHFERYPKLRLYARLLYWANLFTQLYGIDCKEALNAHISQVEAERMYTDLMQDHAAMAELSTFAVNFTYLYRFFYATSLPDPTHYLQVAKTQYNFKRATDVTLCAYLLTHTVINESLFYSRPIPAALKPAYVDSLVWLEEILVQHADTLRLDNLYEFLVCCKLVGYTSRLEYVLHDKEVRNSVDTHGYIVDPKSLNVTFAQSEHRNVLYIMSTINRND